MFKSVKKLFNNLYKEKLKAFRELRTTLNDN